MSTTTTNLGLTKPAGPDIVDFDVLNNNMDLIDTNAGNVANSLTRLLNDVRLYNGTDTLYCKEGVTTGLLMQDNQIKIVPVTWNQGVPAVGTMKGYIDSSGDYHIWDSTLNSGAGGDSTSLATLRDSVTRFYREANGTDYSCKWRIYQVQCTYSTSNILRSGNINYLNYSTNVVYMPAVVFGISYNTISLKITGTPLIVDNESKFEIVIPGSNFTSSDTMWVKAAVLEILNWN